MVAEPEATRRVGDGDHLIALAAGTKLGRYRVESVLGQGGFGITYRATDLELARPVAIKEYLPADVAIRIDGTTVRARSRNDEESFNWGLTRFLDEAKALARFDQASSIVRVHDYLQANGTAYMVMELIEGAPLSEIFRREGTLPETRLKQLAMALLEGLEHLHTGGFLHRDVKPANILIRQGGAPVLIDFGAARQALGGHSRSITGIYTPGYAPFEQYTNEGKQGPWTDIYSLAATLYQGISGRPPLQATDRLLSDRMVPAARAGAGRYSEIFLDAIDRGLAVHPASRPQDVGQWRAMLDGTVKARADEPARGSARKRLTLAASIAVGVAALGGGGWALLGGGFQGTRDFQTELAATEQRLRQLTEDARRAAEEARRRSEEAQAALDAETRRRNEREAQLKAEEDQRRLDEQARRSGDEEARRQAAEAQRKADEARRRTDDEARQKADAEAQRLAALEAQRQAEEQARQKQDAEARLRAEEERRKAEAELAEVRRQVAAAQKEAEERQRQAEQAQLAAEAEAKRLADAEAKKKAEEEAKKKADEDAKKKAEAEAKLKAQQQAAAAPISPEAYLAQHSEAIKAAIIQAIRRRPDDFSDQIQLGAVFDKVTPRDFTDVRLVAGNLTFTGRVDITGRNRNETRSFVRTIYVTVRGYPSAVLGVDLKLASTGWSGQSDGQQQPAAFAYAGNWTYRFSCPGYNFDFGEYEPIAGPTFTWSFKRRVHGTVNGQITGDRMDFLIRWTATDGQDFEGKFTLAAEGPYRFNGSGTVGPIHGGTGNQYGCPIVVSRIPR